MKSNTSVKEKRDETRNPSLPKREVSSANEQRSLDIGESGQCAPGVNEPKRRVLDDDVMPPGREH